VRKVSFVGNRSFTNDRLKDVVQTKSWIWIFRHGTYDSETIDDDTAAVRRFYAGKGFFGRTRWPKADLVADNSELQVNFVIDEGTRYVVDRVTFKGNASLSEADLRKNLKLTKARFTITIFFSAISASCSRVQSIRIYLSAEQQ